MPEARPPRYQFCTGWIVDPAARESFNNQIAQLARVGYVVRDWKVLSSNQNSLGVAVMMEHESYDIKRNTFIEW